MALLGHNPYYCTHKFTYVFIWDARRRYLASYSQDDDSGAESDEEIVGSASVNIVGDDKGNLCGVSQYEMYRSRGESLKSMSLLDYACCVSMSKKKPTEGIRLRVGMKGRGNSGRFAFDSSTKIPTKYSQGLVSCPMVPIVAGAPPPAYPGHRPKLSNGATHHEIVTWERAAKIFVEYYSLLFLPWDHHTDPRDPTLPSLRVLPWDSKTSWVNFSTIFWSWDVDTKGTNDSQGWYKRTSRKIFLNMVDNLRQPKLERELVTKWRAKEADKKTKATKSSRFITEQDAAAYDEGTENVVDGADGMAAVIDVLRLQHGADDFAPSRSEIESLKADTFLAHQSSTLSSLFNTVDYKEPVQEPTLQSYSTETCVKLIADLKTAITASAMESDEEEAVNSGADDEKESLSFDDSGGQKAEVGDFELKVDSDIILTKKQQEIVKRLKYLMSKGQMLAIIQGIPGAGKTTTAKALVQELGIKCLFTGTTATASSQFSSDTVNKLLKLGMNLDNFKVKEIPPAKKNAIIVNIGDCRLIIIDEASMLTPVTLARIEHHLRACFDDKPFGGLHMLQLMDAFQFPPVSKFLPKPSMYQGAVMMAKGMKVPNEAYAVGVNLFTKFNLNILDEQKRASPEYDNFLSQLRQPFVDKPVTEEWLRGLPQLSVNDLTNDERWIFAPIAVTGNLERRAINKIKCKLYGEHNSMPVVAWNCQLRIGQNKKKPIFADVPLFAGEHSGELRALTRYFVVGAECILSETLCSRLKLSKGARGIVQSFVWDDEGDEVPRFGDLPRGAVTFVPQPKYIVVSIKGRTIPISTSVFTIEAKGKLKEDVSYRDHGIDHLFAVTYHKLQGLTLEYLILSLNARAGVSKRVLPISITSLYVGASRVHDFEHIRVLPFNDNDAEQLVKLKRDPMLSEWITNYDKDGNWKHDGFAASVAKHTENILLELALYDSVQELTGAECFYFIKHLDVPVPSSANVGVRQRALEELHKRGREKILSNGGVLLRDLRRKQHNRFLSLVEKKKGIKYIKLKMLRTHAKLLGAKNVNKKNKDKVMSFLEDYKP